MPQVRKLIDFITDLKNKNMEKYIPNQPYVDLLLENSSFNKKVRKGIASYNSSEYKQLQSKLLEFELAMSSKEIISHAENTFPIVGLPN
jgi:acyl CoA:acetate/3-ketoacid CoA transferase alpha subunit